jgi:two-component system, cell cycle sensor histidine kinase and response regulator CckA
VLVNISAVTDSVTEQRLADLADLVQAVVWEAELRDTDLQLTWVNREAAAMLDQPDGWWAADGALLSSIVHPDDHRRIVSTCAALTEAQPERRLDYRVTAAGGRTIWLAGRVTLIGPDSISPDVIGTALPPRVRAALTDVTAQRLSRASHHAIEQRYRDLFDNADIVVFTADLEGRFTSVNPMGEVLTGYTAAEVVTMRVAEVVAPEFLPTALDMLQRKRSGEVVETHVELEILTKDGRRVPVEVRSRVIFENGVPVGVQGSGRDLTERRRAAQALHASEQERARLAEAAEHDSAVRRELEDQLRQAQKMEAIGRLAAGVAHDFNNLLTIISGYSEVLTLQVPQGTRLHKAAAAVHHATERGAALTQQLLAFSRRQVLAPRVLDLNALIDKTAILLPRLIGEDIELIVSSDGQTPHVKADPTQIEHVLLNLAANARDAMPNGGTLRVSTSCVSIDAAQARRYVGLPSGDYVLLIVSDTGAGMDADTRRRVFEPFFTTKPRGTGLGLASVYGIITQSGGHIGVASTPGQGTSFIAHLPRVKDPVEAYEPPAPVATLHGSETVLVVEDEDAVRALLRESLDAFGYTTLEASGGAMALELGSTLTTGIDLLVTDLVMPHMNGRELAERFVAARPGLKVLFVTGYADESFTTPPGIQAMLLRKPFTGREFARAVRDLLDAPAASGHASHR